MIEVLKETNFSTLGKKKTGKVRDIYEPSTGSGQGSLILISTDRHSSFDRIIAHIPHKGQVLNQVSAWWFERTKDIVPNHVIAIPDPNVTVGKKCKMVPVEAVSVDPTSTQGPAVDRAACMTMDADDPAPQSRYVV